MSNPFQTKEFKALHDKWNKKLEKEGLKEIDNTGISHADYFRLNYNNIDASSKAEYYRNAGYFLYEHKFKTELERKIWELHAEGVSIRDIVNVLKKQRFKVYKRLIHETLRPMVEKLLKKMKVK